MSNITKEDNTKSKKGRVVILVRDMSSCPVLHFYQKLWLSIWWRNHLILIYISLKYHQSIPKAFKGYSCYRADKKCYADAANGICPKNNMSTLLWQVRWGVGGRGRKNFNQVPASPTASSFRKQSKNVIYLEYPYIPGVPTLNKHTNCLRSWYSSESCNCFRWST